MDPRLIEILVCPLCKGPLVMSRDRQELICKADRLAYPIREGIPVLITSDARELAPTEEAP